MTEPGFTPTPLLPMIDEADASPEVAEIYEEIKVILGSNTFVPNFFKAQAGNVHRLGLTWTLVKSVLCEGMLPRLLKEMVFVEVADSVASQYCRSAHLAFCAKLGVGAETCDVFLHEAPTTMFRAEYCTLLDYTRVLARHIIGPERDRVLDKIAAVDPLLIAELVQMIALAAYASALADALQIPVDPEFQAILGHVA